MPFKLKRLAKLQKVEAGRRPLRPWQEKGFQYAKKRNHPGFLMSMRLGKTLLAIRWVQSLIPAPKSVVVVAPLTVLEAWENELRTEGETFITAYGQDAAERLERVKLVHTTRKGRRWLLINYESVLATPLISKLYWDVVICDEVTKLKNPKAQTTKLFCKGFRDASHRVILTGLIRPESHLEVFCPMIFLHGVFMGHTSFWKWRAQYFRQTTDGFGWEPYPEARAVIKDMIHRKCFVMSREEAGVGSLKLPPLTRMVRMTPEQEKMYKEVERNYATTLLSGEYVDTQWAMTMQMWLTKITGGFDPENNFLSPAKKNEILELLGGELKDEKVVIWFRYRHEVEYVRQALIEAGIFCTSILGGEKMEDRKRKIREFRSSRYLQAFLATEKLAKFGIDASVADAAIYYSNEWSNEDRTQSEDRVVNPAQDVQNLIIDLVCKGTVDEDFVETIHSKQFASKEFMAKNETDEDRQRFTELIRCRTLDRWTRNNALAKNPIR